MTTPPPPPPPWSTPIPAAPEPPPRSSRRAWLIGGGLAALGAIGAGAYLLRRDDGDSAGATVPTTSRPQRTTTTRPSSTRPSTTTRSSSPTVVDDRLRILNWVQYIADDTVTEFERSTGIEVAYDEGFNDNEEVFRRELRPALSRDEPAEHDIVVPTNWMVARLHRLEFLETLPRELIPNATNLDPVFTGLAFDPTAATYLPWQAGYTGIAYNRRVTGRDLTSVDELFNPEWRGQVGLFTEMRDTLGLTLLSLGLDPSTAGEAELDQALDQLAAATDDGQFRRFTGNDYLQDLVNGNFAVCMAWAGDILFAGSDDVGFVYPDEGTMAWFDAMVIPKGSPHVEQAAAWMDFVYDPANAAKITAEVQYVSPVVGVQDELRRLGGEAAELADNPLLFPDKTTRQRARVFADLAPTVETATVDRFQRITNT